MRKNEIYSGLEMKKKLLAGIMKVSDAVSSTLGARGRTVMIEQEFGVPHITKDGVTVAKSIHLKEPIENVGAKLIRQASEMTNREAGDGTTTSTLLASEMIKEGMKFVASGVDPNAIRRGIEKVIVNIIEDIKAESREIKDSDEIMNVALISSNGDQVISRVVTEALDKVGKDGIIMVENSSDDRTYFETHEGYNFDKGFFSPFFSTDMTKYECVMEGANVLLINGDISEVQTLAPLLSECAQKGKKLVIFTDNVGNETLQIFVQNKMRGVISCCLVKNDGYGQSRLDFLEDMSAVTGAKVFSKDMGDDFSKITMKDLGIVKKIIVDRDKTTILRHEALDDSIITPRIEALKSRLTTIESAFEKKKIEERIAKLQGGIGVIFVGAVTEAELKERKDRLDDAINATRSAIQEGIVCGGGAFLLKLSELMTESNVDENIEGDEIYGFKILKKVLQAPLKKIVENSGRSGDVIAEKIIDSDFKLKYDARNDVMVDYDDPKIIDPTKVVRLALTHASSTACLILTSDYCVVFEEEFPDMMERSGGGL